MIKNAPGYIKKSVFNEKSVLISTGLIIGFVMVILSIAGNPQNMAFCAACFLRDITGALGLLQSPGAQYMRPEIPGLVIGACAAAVYKKEFAAKGGSSPFTRFVLGMCAMVGALIFMGCPMRMLLRLAGGDLNAAVGFAGLAAGVVSGALFLKAGFSLGKAYALPKTEKYLFPAANVLLILLALALPAVFYVSESGSGALRAPVYISLAAGLAVGACGYHARICFIGDIRDFVLFKTPGAALCSAVIFAVVLIGNISTGRFRIGFNGQPFAHSDFIWNFAGLYLTGFACTLLGGCPFRQLVMAGGGNADAAVTVLGLTAGAAFSHNLGINSTPAGASPNGKAAFAICLIVTLAIAYTNIKKTEPGGARA